MSGKAFTQTIYIDALALVSQKKSGVGLTLEQIVKNLQLQKGGRKYTIYLVVPLAKARYLRKYLGSNVKTKTIYLPARLMEVLLRLGLFPPADWFLGRGIYLFPNYRNWPLWRSKSLTYIYDLGFLLFPETVQPKNQKYLRRYINRWVWRTDKLVTISHQVMGEIEKHLNVPYNMIEVIYCGVDKSLFYRRTASEIATIKKKYNINFENYFLFVGNIEPRKNLIKLLEAYEKLPDRLRKTYGLVIVGSEGWLNQEFYTRLAQAQADSEKVLKVAQYVKNEDLPALYSGAAALVQPAVYEGFGITPLEAMACETPVAVSDVPAIREVVQTAGCYFDPSSSDSIARALVKVAKNEALRRTLIGEGKKRAEELTWAKTARQLISVIETEIAKGPRNKPVIMRLKALHNRADQKIRAALGEKPYDAYRPRGAKTKQELKQIISQDFAYEQPTLLQIFLLATYLRTKHLLAIPIKKTYRMARSFR